MARDDETMIVRPLAAAAPEDEPGWSGGRRTWLIAFAISTLALAIAIVIVATGSGVGDTPQPERPAAK